LCLIESICDPLAKGLSRQLPIILRPTVENFCFYVEILDKMYVFAYICRDLAGQANLNLSYSCTVWRVQTMIINTGVSLFFEERQKCVFLMFRLSQ